jgi:hypothetical protein
MNIRISLIITMISITHLLYAQSRWLQEYFPGLNVVSEDFVECYDKGYLMTGKFGPNYVHYCWLIKTDINGEVIWNKTFGEPDSYISFFSIAGDKTGSIFLSGGTSFYDALSDPFVTKLNACGEKLWCLDFNTPEHFDYAYTIVSTNDGGCAVLLRYTGITPPQTDRLCLAKIDANGNMLWKHCYNSSDTNLLNEDGRSLLITSDKGFLITGNCDYHDSITNLDWVKPYLIKTDSLGNFQWERVINVYDDNYIGGSANYSTISPSGQFYYTSISHYYYNPESERPALGKLDLNGNVIGVYDIIQGFNNGGLASAQFINDSTLAAVCGWGNGMDDFRHYLALIDTLGNIVDTILISQDIYSGVLHLCHDNKLVDMYNTYQNDQFDVYLRKLNYSLEDDTLYTRPFVYDSLCPYQIVSDTIVPDDCGLIVGIEEHDRTVGREDGKKEEGGLEVWPNPSSGMLNVECLMLNEGSDYELIVYDIFGRISSLPRLGEGQGGGHEGGDRGWKGWKVDVSSLPSGIYFISIMESGNRVAGGKFVVSR